MRPAFVGLGVGLAVVFAIVALDRDGVQASRRWAFEPSLPRGSMAAVRGEIVRLPIRGAGEVSAIYVRLTSRAGGKFEGIVGELAGEPLPAWGPKKGETVAFVAADVEGP